MRYVKKTWKLIDNYLLARWMNKPSTAAFWYLPEPANIVSNRDLFNYKNAKSSPRYLLDYRHKLRYTLSNEDGIIVLPYDAPTGQQVNPEAAFQYALGLHDQYHVSTDPVYLNKFMHYANYFLEKQTSDGLWEYEFDWFGSRAPWHSALAQARGAVVMLRAWKQSKNACYLTSAQRALDKFMVPTAQGGFLHIFTPQNCVYFEEYPHTPTGVINCFMACLMNIWEMKYWTGDPSLDALWKLGIESLEKMLPYYSNGWWSLYDLDPETPLANVNSPRYHLMEMNYLQILSTLSDSMIIKDEYQRRVQQYKPYLAHARALSLKFIRKIRYK